MFYQYQNDEDITGHRSKAGSSVVRFAAFSGVRHSHFISGCIPPGRPS
jgi:hypothetical protein